MYADAEMRSNRICKINTNISEKTFQEFSNSSKTRFIYKVEQYIKIGDFVPHYAEIFCAKGDLVHNMPVPPEFT